MRPVECPENDLTNHINSEIRKAYNELLRRGHDPYKTAKILADSVILGFPENQEIVHTFTSRMDAVNAVDPSHEKLKENNLDDIPF
jgi:hypothetical protein